MVGTRKKKPHTHTHTKKEKKNPLLFHDDVSTYKAKVSVFYLDK